MMAEIEMKYQILKMPLELFHDLNGYCILKKMDFTKLIQQALALWLVLVKADDVEIIVDGKNLTLNF